MMENDCIGKIIVEEGVPIEFKWNWHKSIEKVPENYREVLGYTSGRDYEVVYYDKDRGYFRNTSGHSFFINMDDDEIPDLNYWMELPSAPMESISQQVAPLDPSDDNGKEPAPKDSVE